jgi:hypothetical protein
VDGSQVGVFEQSDQVGFTGFLKSSNGRGLESKVSLEVLGNFSDKSLEGQLSDQELSRLLVSSDFSKSDGTRLVSVRLLDCRGKRKGVLAHAENVSPTSMSLWYSPPPAAGADLRAALVANCLRGAFPPVDFLAVCLVLAMTVMRES